MPGHLKNNTTVIKETYLSVQKKVIPEGDIVFDITGLGKGQKSVSPLAPSKMLLDDWNNDRILWKEFVERYFLQLYQDQRAKRLLDEIISLSMEKGLWLVGQEEDYPCQRFLLKQIIEKVLYARKVISSVQDYSELYRKFKNLTKSQAIIMKKSGRSSPIPPSLPTA